MEGGVYSFMGLFVYDISSLSPDAEGLDPSVCALLFLGNMRRGQSRKEGPFWRQAFWKMPGIF